MTGDHVQVFQVDGIVIIELLDGFIDESNLDAIRQQVVGFIGAGHHRLIFDFSGVTHISSVGVR